MSSFKNLNVPAPTKRTSKDKKAESPPRARGPKCRHYCLTTFDTKKYKEWKNLDFDDCQIRYLIYQIEKSPSTGRLHLQAYIEFYNALRITQVKTRLNDATLHCERRKGTRQQARDYCMKDDSHYFSSKYPEWVDHGFRHKGTKYVELGKFRTKQGHRTDLDQMIDKIQSGASEFECFASCPSQYLKYSTGVRRARCLMKRDRVNRYHRKMKRHVLYGDPGSGKTRYVFDKHGPENVFCPTYSASAQKFWFDGYDGQKVLLINEFYGQARTSVMQELLDKYRIRVETKGGTTVSNWDHIYVTSNCHPDEWYNSWNSVPYKVRRSFHRRIDDVTYVPHPDSEDEDESVPLTFGNHPSIDLTEFCGGAASITPATSVPRTPEMFKNVPPRSKRARRRLRRRRRRASQSPKSSTPSPSPPDVQNEDMFQQYMSCVPIDPELQIQSENSDSDVECSRDL